jgi:hypothetical protein
MFKMPTAVTALFVAGMGLVGLACSSSGLKSRAGDAGAGSGGRAGSTISSGAPGGSGGTIGPGGAGGASIGGTGGVSSSGGAGGINISGTGGIIGSGGAGGGSTRGAGGTSGPGSTIGTGGSKTDGGTAGSSGTGSTGGQGPICALYRMCNPGDQQVGMDCPSERECYTLSVSCGSGGHNTTTCLLPQGLHCDDSLLCNTGDTQIRESDDGCLGNPNACYTKQLCTQSILCLFGTHAGVDAAASDASVDAGVNGGPMPFCGDGILQTNLGEQCDLGPLNGVRPDGSWGCVPCGTDCTVSLCLL